MRRACAWLWIDSISNIYVIRYTESEIVRAERYMLQVLKFNMQYPTPLSFLRRSSKADSYDIQTRTLAKYLMEITLLDHRFLGIRASKIAAAAHYLARHMLDRGDWVCLLGFV